MKKTLAVLLMVVLAIPLTLAVAQADPPPKGCDQAAENDGDPYDSTCDGSASQNGEGDGNANGKPCAGCVGSADNMNPNGQLPDGGDPNAGYECDTNKGVGQSNPAHTSCEPYADTTAAGDQKKMEGSATSFLEMESENETSALSGGVLVGILLALIVVSTGARGIGRRLRKDSDT